MTKLILVLPWLTGNSKKKAKLLIISAVWLVGFVTSEGF